MAAFGMRCGGEVFSDILMQYKTNIAVSMEMEKQ